MFVCLFACLSVRFVCLFVLCMSIIYYLLSMMGFSTGLQTFHLIQRSFLCFKFGMQMKLWYLVPRIPSDSRLYIRKLKISFSFEFIFRVFFPILFVVCLHIVVYLIHKMRAAQKNVCYRLCFALAVSAKVLPISFLCSRLID